MIQILDLTRQYQALQAEMNAAVLSVLGSGHYIMGPNVKAFESEVAQYLGTSQAIGVASGTDALYLALKALGIGPGDEVITTAFSYIATSESIARAGGTPVFAEVDPTTFNIDVTQIEEKITPRTRALLPVHLYGQPVDMDALMALAKKHNLFVVEDCAQAMGTEWRGKKVGTFGEFGCYSFFPTKNLGCYGDGGLVSTNDAALADKVRVLKAHGSKTRYYHVTEGINSRLDEVQAAVLRVKLPHLDSWNAGRQRVAQQYNAAFSQIPGVTAPVALENGQHVFHQYTLRLGNTDPAVRDQVQQSLQERGVQSMIYYPLPLHLQGMHQSLGYQAGDLPITEALAHEVLSLPIFPELTEAEIQHVVQAVQESLQQVLQPA